MGQDDPPGRHVGQRSQRDLAGRVRPPGPRLLPAAFGDLGQPVDPGLRARDTRVGRSAFGPQRRCRGYQGPDQERQWKRAVLRPLCDVLLHGMPRGGRVPDEFLPPPGPRRLQRRELQTHGRERQSRLLSVGVGRVHAVVPGSIRHRSDGSEDDRARLRDELLVQDPPGVVRGNRPEGPAPLRRGLRRLPRALACEVARSGRRDISLRARPHASSRIS